MNSFRTSRAYVLLFIILTLQATKSEELRVWENKKMEVSSFITQYKTDITAMQKSAEYTCFQLKAVDAAMKEFGNKVESYRSKRYTIATAIYDIIFWTNSALNTLKHDHEISTHKILSVFDHFGFTVLKDGNNADMQTTTSMVQTTLKIYGKNQVDFFNNLSQMPKPKEVEELAFEDEFDFKKVGNFVAKGLYHENYSCFNIPDITNFIYKLIYYSFIPKHRIKRFLSGFYDGIMHQNENSKENKFREILLDKYFKFNIELLLRADNEFSEKIILILKDKHGATDKEKIISNLSLFYQYVLYVTSEFEKTPNQTVGTFFTGLFNKNQDLIVDLGKKGATLFALYVVNYGKAYLPPSVQAFADTISDTQFKETEAKIKDAIRDAIQNKKKDAMNYIKDKVKNGKLPIPEDDIKNFSNHLLDHQQQIRNEDDFNIKRLYKIYILDDNSPISSYNTMSSIRTDRSPYGMAADSTYENLAMADIPIDQNYEANNNNGIPTETKANFSQLI